MSGLTFFLPCAKLIGTKIQLLHKCTIGGAILKSLDIKISRASLLKFALPTIISNIFMSFYSTIDGMFVSYYVGTDALSAVNIFMPFVMIVLALGVMIGTGGSAYIGAQLGEGKEKEAKENFTMLSLVCLVSCIIASALSYIFKEPLLQLLGANDVIYGYCLDYAVPLIFVAPIALVGMALQSFFITAGKPALGMLFSISGGVLNVFLDWLLIGELKLGLTGAALATGLGYSVPGVAGVIYFLFKRKGMLCFVKPRWRFNVLLKTITNGSSEMVGMTATGITTVMMNNIVMGFAGEDGVAAISILIYAMTLLTSVYMGYSLGVAPIMSYNYGADRRDNLKKANKISITFIAVISVAMYIVGLIFKDFIISVFATKGTAVFEMAQSGYLLFSISFIYMGFNMYASSLFTSLGNGKISAIISFCRGLVFLTASLYILSAIFGLTGLWIAMPVAELLGLIVSAVFIYKKKEEYGYV